MQQLNTMTASMRCRNSLVPMVLILLLVQPALALSQTQAQFLDASPAEYSNPHDLRLGPDGKYLFVSDVNNNRVAILDPDSLEFVGEFGAADQAGTHDVDFDAAGNAYVADTHNNRVLIYALDGLKATLTGELSDRIRGPEGVLVHPDGRVYVAGAWSNNVVVYQDGKVINELGGLSSPHDLAFDLDGNIWLADAGNNRMLLLSPELEIERQLSGPPYDFNGVRYQDVMDNGTLVAADKNSHSVKVISKGGDLLLRIGDKPGLGENRFRTPEGVEIRGNTVWISDSGNNRIVKYRIE